MNIGSEVAWASVSAATAGIVAVLTLRRSAGPLWHRARAWSALVVVMDSVAAAAMTVAGQCATSLDAVEQRGLDVVGNGVAATLAALIGGRLIPYRTSGDGTTRSLRRYALDETAVIARAERTAYIVAVLVPAARRLNEDRLRHLVLEQLSECARCDTASPEALHAARVEASTAAPAELVTILVTYAAFAGARRVLSITVPDPPARSSSSRTLEEGRDVIHV